MRHQSGLCQLEQDVDGLARPHQHGVVPHEVAVRFAIAFEHEEAPDTAYMEGVVHRVVAVR